MKKIFYITRTLPEGNTGGALIRRGSIRFLQEKGFRVVVVAPSDHDEITEERILVKGPLSFFSINWNRALFGLGLRSDYLENWALNAKNVLLRIVKKDDLILATSGGELGTLMLASFLKQTIGCKIIYNLHDPIVFTLIEGAYSYESKHKVKPRDHAEKRVFKDADYIVTSSNYYAGVLKQKYPEFADKFTCHHFGYIDKIENPQVMLLDNPQRNVVYGGNMGSLQGPEILLEVAKYFPKIQFTFIGKVSFDGLTTPENVQILPLMKHNEYIDYLVSSADIGFLSLVGNVSRLCVPSKLYEYINVGLPILAAIEGDAKQIVNSNHFGIATNYDVYALADAINTLLADNNLERFKRNILDHRHEWYMGNTIKELIEVL